MSRISYSKTHRIEGIILKNISSHNLNTVPNIIT